MISDLIDKFGLIAGTGSDAWDTCDMKIYEKKQLPVVWCGAKSHHKIWCLNWLPGSSQQAWVMQRMAGAGRGAKFSERRMVTIALVNADAEE